MPLYERLLTCAGLVKRTVLRDDAAHVLILTACHPVRAEWKTRAGSRRT